MTCRCAMCADGPGDLVKRGWWWLSFAGEEGFRGVAVVFADSFLRAVVLTKRLQINPGGEVMGRPLERPPAPRYRNRLLSRDETLAAGGRPRSS